MSCGSSLCIQFIGEMIVDDEFKKKKKSRDNASERKTCCGYAPTDSRSSCMK